jgi:mono/diheme cytochrome c family protein
MAPFYLSYADFRPAEEILGLPEGPLLPYAVTRLHFASAAELDALLPAGLTGAAAQGARLARRDCLSCHFHHGVGGQLSGRPWALIATWAKIDPNYVRKYVRNPKGVQPESKMPGFPHYGDEAVEALVAYFKAFQP